MAESQPKAAAMEAASYYMNLTVDSKRYVLEADRDKVFQRLRKENRCCFDCNSRNPTWISLSMGIYICLTCSGKHRRLGSHISFVRSSEMDKFFPEQLLRMDLGGNKRAGDFFRQHGLDLSRPLDYNGKLAAKYRALLDRQVQQEMQKIGWTVAQKESTVSAPAEVVVEPKVNTVKTVETPQISNTPNYPSQNPSQNVVPMTYTNPSIAPANPNGFAAASRPRDSAAIGIKGRKLDTDFDFDAEAEKIAVRKQIPVQEPVSDKAPNRSMSRSSNETPPNPMNSLLKNQPYGSNMTKTPTEAANTKPADLQSRFSGAKSISSSQMFHQDSDSDYLRRGLHMDPSKQSIGSDEIFGTRSGPQRSSFENQSMLHIESLKSQAQQGWSQLAQVSSDAMSKARNWLAGS